MHTSSELYPGAGSSPDHEGGVQGDTQGDLRDEARQPASRKEAHPAQVVHQAEAWAAAAELRPSGGRIWSSAPTPTPALRPPSLQLPARQAWQQYMDICLRTGTC